jgi:predicted O-methyltransferase YrrM
VELENRLIRTVDGWLSEKEGRLLSDLARRCKGRGVIVEIGSWKGRSTLYLAQGSKRGNTVKIYAVDNHTGSPELVPRFGTDIWTFDEFARNIERFGVGDLVIPIVKTSAEAAAITHEPVELIFVDGAHDYESVKKDFELWSPKVVDGGVIAFHDTDKPGPKKLVEEALYRSSSFRGVRVVGITTYATKVSSSVANVLRNRVAYLRDRVAQLLRRYGASLPL